MIKKIIFIFMS